MTRTISYLDFRGTGGQLHNEIARQRNQRLRSAGLLVLFLSFLMSAAAEGQGVPYKLGDIFVSVSSGQVQHRDGTGNLLEILNTRQGAATTGMAFDSLGNLYVTDFDAGTVSKFDSQGALIG